jgi:hypothetical protein
VINGFLLKDFTGSYDLQSTIAMICCANVTVDTLCDERLPTVGEGLYGREFSQDVVQIEEIR